MPTHPTQGYTPTSFILGNSGSWGSLSAQTMQLVTGMQVWHPDESLEGLLQSKRRDNSAVHTLEESDISNRAHPVQPIGDASRIRVHIEHALVEDEVAQHSLT